MVGIPFFGWIRGWEVLPCMCVQYRRIFDLAVNKSITVVEMCNLGWEDDGAAWQCCRRLWAWEEDLLGECRILLRW